MGRLASLGKLEDPKYILVQTDMEVWEILESIGLPKDYCAYLLVAVGDAEYQEIWGTDSFRLDGTAEQLFWMGKVTANG